LINDLVYGTFFSYVYKAYGEDNDLSDNLLTWAGSIGALTNCLARFCCGALFDKIGFKPLFMTLIAL
jgi:MFS family permease